MDGKQFPTSIDQLYLAQRLGSGIWRVSGATRPDRNLRDYFKWQQMLRSLSDVGREKLWEAMENELEQQQQEETAIGAVAEEDDLPEAADWDLDLVYSGYPSAVELERAKLFPLIYAACFWVVLIAMERASILERILDRAHTPFWMRFLGLWLILIAFGGVPFSMWKSVKAHKTWREREEKRQ